MNCSKIYCSHALLWQDYPNSVEFLFVRTGVLNAEGHNTRQTGKEWICFTAASSPDAPPAISRVIVETFSTELMEASEQAHDK